jgi:hypothetical protein
MPGLGKKTFASGDPLTAAQVNGYLMDQSVMRFASAAARDAAIPSPTEGMNCYLDDQNWLMVYTGSAWTITGGDKPFFYVSGTNTFLNNTDTQVDFTGKVVTNRGSFSLSGTPALVLAPQTGLYSITATLQWPANATGYRHAYMDIQGTLWQASHPTATTSVISYLSISATQLLSAGNYIALRGIQNSTATLTGTFKIAVTYLGS